MDSHSSVEVIGPVTGPSLGIWPDHNDRLQKQDYLISSTQLR